MEKQSASSIEGNAVTAWFGEMFFELHPGLQSLHRKGGVLKGDIDLQFGEGIGGFFGKRIARRLGVPSKSGKHELRVEIRHADGKLYWSRCFDGQHIVQSIFTPFGNFQNGYWLENTGPVTLKLVVDVNNGAWYWRVTAIRFLGLPIPLFLFPDSVAYKKVIDDRYQFHVGFSMPWIGRLFSYEGNLVFESD